MTHYLCINDICCPLDHLSTWHVGQAAVWCTIWYNKAWKYTQGNLCRAFNLKESLILLRLRCLGTIQHNMLVICWMNIVNMYVDNPPRRAAYMWTIHPGDQHVCGQSTQESSIYVDNPPRRSACMWTIHPGEQHVCGQSTQESSMYVDNPPRRAACMWTIRPGEQHVCYTGVKVYHSEWTVPQKFNTTEN